MASSTVPNAEPPSPAQIRRSLGAAFAAWEALLDPSLGRTMEWKRYSKNAPWALRVNEGKKTVFWVRPTKGELHVTLIVGEKKVQTGLAGRLPGRLKDDLRKAPKYPEGRAVRLRMRTAARVADVERLVSLKLGRE